MEPQLVASRRARPAPVARLPSTIINGSPCSASFSVSMSSSQKTIVNISLPAVSPEQGKVKTEEPQREKCVLNISGN